MNINQVQNEVSEIVATLVTRLDKADHIADCDALAARARKQLETVRKKFQRVIDERLLGRPGYRGFAIHEREAIQSLLSTLILQADSQTEVLVTARREQIGEQHCPP